VYSVAWVTPGSQLRARNTSPLGTRSDIIRVVGDFVAARGDVSSTLERARAGDVSLRVSPFADVEKHLATAQDVLDGFLDL